MIEPINERDALLMQGNGSIFVNLKTDILKNHIVSIPPLPEQKAIAGVLSSLDDKIDLLHRQNKTLEAMAETLFRQWFIEEAENDWEERILSDYADNVKNNVTLKDLGLFNNYIGLEHLPRKQIVLDECGNTLNLGSNKNEFRKKDILFGKLRPYFHKVVFAPFNGVCSTDILVIRPKEEAYFAFCLFWFFSSDVINYANMGSGGTRMPRTDWKTLSQYKIQAPPKAKIHNFNQIFSPIEEKLLSNSTQISQLKTLRDSLIPILISGDVRVTADVQK